MKEKFSKKVKRKLNPKAKGPIRIDLGCGKNKRKDGEWIGVDELNFDGVDVVLNVGKSKWPWKDGSVDEVHASHFVEHLKPEERIHFVNELFRVLKNPQHQDGKIVSGFATVIVPHWASQRAYGDLTHCFSDDTEILSESGWKPISSIKIGDRVLSLDLNTEKSHFEEVVATINEPYIGPMLHFESECLDLMVTPNHDMVWRAKTNSNSAYYKKKGVSNPRPKLRKSKADTFEKMGGHHPRCGSAVINWIGESPEKIRISEDELSLGRVLNAEFNMVGIYQDSDLWYPKPKRVHYSGNMVCVTLANHHNIMVRRKGSPIWSGNCWPPVSEFWFYYLDKGWRAVNAPHNQDYKCNFNVTWGYNMHPEIAGRNQEYQQNAMKYWKEACSDTIAQFSKKLDG